MPIEELYLPSEQILNIIYIPIYKYLNISLNILLKMVLKLKTKTLSIGISKYILIPSKVLNDSYFPFKDMSNLEICIENKKLVIKEGEKWC